MGYTWHWQVFLQPASGKETYLDWLLLGLWTTVKMGTLAWILAFVLGSLLGVLRTVPNRLLSRAATVYVEIVRNVPLIVQLFLWYYLVPKLLPHAWRAWLFAQPPATSAFVTGTLEPYIEPECLCAVSTTLTGTAVGDTIRGTFVTRSASGESHDGQWKLVRRPAPKH